MEGLSFFAILAGFHHFGNYRMAVVVLVVPILAVSGEQRFDSYAREKRFSNFDLNIV